MALIFRITGMIILAAAFSMPAMAQRGGPQGPMDVIVASVKKAAFADSIEALGTTKANETVIITAQTADKVTEIHFEDGQVVEKDTLLITLDQAEEQARLRAFQAQLSEAQSAYNRAKSLQGNQALSKATLQERLAGLKDAQAQVETLQAQIDQRTITAPFDGILGLRDVSIGTLVQPGDVITTIDDLSQIKVDFEVPAVFLSALAPGLPISGRIEAFSDQVFTGTIRTINTQVNPATRSIRVRAVLPNPDMLLKPGLLMSIVVEKNRRQALLIPEESLLKRADKNFVFIAEKQADGTIAREHEITIGSRARGVIEVLSGLSEGDQVIAHGTVKVKDGAPITIRATEEEDTPLDQLLLQPKPNGHAE